MDAPQLIQYEDKGNPEQTVETEKKKKKKMRLLRNFEEEATPLAAQCRNHLFRGTEESSRKIYTVLGI